jgi:hypothetical protein
VLLSEKTIKTRQGEVIKKNLPRAISGVRGVRGKGVDQDEPCLTTRRQGLCDKCRFFRDAVNALISYISNGRELSRTHQKLRKDTMRCPREPWAAPVRVGSTGWEDSQNTPKSGHKKLPRTMFWGLSKSVGVAGHHWVRFGKLVEPFKGWKPSPSDLHSGRVGRVST